METSALWDLIFHFEFHFEMFNTFADAVFHWSSICVGSFVSSCVNNVGM